jgi:micrococcal nuclease
MTVKQAGIVLCAAGWLAGAAPPPFEGAGLKRLATVDGLTAVDGARFVLPDGRRGRLAGVIAPRLAPPGARYESEPLAAEAKAALARLTAGKRIVIWAYDPPHRVDRYGRLVVHLSSERGGWVQGELLALGMLRVRTRPDDRALAGRMLALEARARQAKRGLWADAHFQVRRDTDVRPGGFAIVEGKVLTVAERWRFAYLNFGRYWRRDFTIVIDRRARRLFRAAKIQLTELKGARVRVRGWVQERGGPMIQVTHPEQIERLPPKPPGPRRR